MIKTMVSINNNNLNSSAFGGKTPIGYIDTSRYKLMPGQQYGIIHCVGNCMDSPESPMRIKDDCYLLLRYLTPHIKTLRAEIGNVVAVETSMGTFTKCLTAVNARKRTISLTMYKPARVTMVFPMQEIKRIYKVEDIFTREYIASHMRHFA